MNYTIAENITDKDFTIAIGEMIMQAKTLVELLKILQANNLGIDSGGDDQDVDLDTCRLDAYVYDKKTDWWMVRNETTINLHFYPFDHVVEIFIKYQGNNESGGCDYMCAVTF